MRAHPDTVLTVDVFQIIVKEKGVFTNVTSPSTKAKLRLLFEVAPLALLVSFLPASLSQFRTSLLSNASAQAVRPFCNLYIANLHAFFFGERHLTLRNSLHFLAEALIAIISAFKSFIVTGPASSGKTDVTLHQGHVSHIADVNCAVTLQVEQAGGHSSCDGLLKSGLDVEIKEHDQRTQVHNQPSLWSLNPSPADMTVLWVAL